MTSKASKPRVSTNAEEISSVDLDDVKREDTSLMILSWSSASVKVELTNLNI